MDCVFAFHNIKYSHFYGIEIFFRSSLIGKFQFSYRYISSDGRKSADFNQPNFSLKLNVWLKWKILLNPGKWHIFWRFGPYWLQKYPFRQDRWKIRRWWVILPRHLSYLLILHKYFFQRCNSLVILFLFNSLHRNLSEK